MKLADRSPGLLMVLAAAVVYGVILVEIAMYVVATTVFMAGTLALALVVALAIAAWFHRLVSDDEEELATAPAPVAAPVREPSVARAPRASALPA